MNEQHRLILNEHEESAVRGTVRIRMKHHVLFHRVDKEVVLSGSILIPTPHMMRNELNQNKTTSKGVQL